jgi:adenine phosphoribosyltransferase
MDEDRRMRARAVVLERFRWVDGHADVWPVFADAAAFALTVEALAWPWRDAGVTKVCGIESRGFVLGGAVAHELGAGFVAVRKTDGLLPGVNLHATSAPDYRGQTHTLRLQRAQLDPPDRVLLVDDWAEAGSQAMAAKQLIERSSASFVGLSIIVDQLSDARRAEIGSVTTIVHHRDLP